MRLIAEKDFSGLISTPEKVDALQVAVLTWFGEHGRYQIPWKLKKDGTSPKSG